MEILGVLVQDKATKFLHGKLKPGPDLGDIEGVEAEFVRISIFGLHNLDLSSPLDLLSSLNRFPEVALGVVRILTTHLCSLFLCELLLAVLRNEVVLDVDKFALSIGPPEGVASVAVVKPSSIGSAVITEEPQTSMVSLRSAAKQVKDAVVVEQGVFGIAVLRSYDIWALDRVSAEKDGLVKPMDVLLNEDNELRSSIPQCQCRYEYVRMTSTNRLRSEEIHEASTQFIVLQC